MILYTLNPQNLWLLLDLYIILCISAPHDSLFFKTPIHTLQSVGKNLKSLSLKSFPKQQTYNDQWSINTYQYI